VFWCLFWQLRSVFVFKQRAQGTSFWDHDILMSLLQLHPFLATSRVSNLLGYKSSPRNFKILKNLMMWPITWQFPLMIEKNLQNFAQNKHSLWWVSSRSYEIYSSVTSIYAFHNISNGSFYSVNKDICSHWSDLSIAPCIVPHCEI
jgi:hypothetical protein